MIPRAALQSRTQEWGLTEEVVEKDYILGWLLWGIGSHESLRDDWVFKGGTCLKKCFVETYRFSEDLDFTVLPGGPLAPDELLPVLEEMLDRVEQETGIAFLSRPPIVRLRPDGHSAEGRIYYRGPRGAPGEARVKLDLTYDEILVEEAVRRSIAHAYDDVLPGDAAVQCYSFVELFAEKLRALGQRTRPRDLYDVVNLYRRADLRDDRDLVFAVLERKCAFKEVPIPTLEAVTAEQKATDLRADWTRCWRTSSRRCHPSTSSSTRSKGCSPGSVGKTSCGLSPCRRGVSRSSRASWRRRRSRRGQAARRSSRSVSQAQTTCWSSCAIRAPSG